MVLILHNIFDKIPENGEHYQNNILAIHRQIFLSIFLQYPDNIGIYSGNIWTIKGKYLYNEVISFAIKTTQSCNS